jgi:hypothetical protein
MTYDACHHKRIARDVGKIACDFGKAHYDLFQNHRRNDFSEIAGDPAISELSVKKIIIPALSAPFAFRFRINSCGGLVDCFARARARVRAARARMFVTSQVLFHPIQQYKI